MEEPWQVIKACIPGMNARIGYELSRFDWTRTETQTFSSSFPTKGLDGVEIYKLCKNAVTDILEQINDERARRLSVTCQITKQRCDFSDDLFVYEVDVVFTDPRNS